MKTHPHRPSEQVGEAFLERLIAHDLASDDPLAAVWESEVVPLLKNTPGLRPVAVFDEIRRRHPEISVGVRRTVERRIRNWRTLSGAERDVISGRSTRRVGWGCPISPTWAITASALPACRSITG